MEQSGISEGYDTYVRGLLRFSRVLEQKKALEPRPLQPKGGGTPEVQEAPQVAPLSFSLTYASPLSPLRSRDIQALLEIFTHDQLTEIEADVQQYLRRLHPEPCWEVEPYEFLKGFI